MHTQPVGRWLPSRPKPLSIHGSGSGQWLRPRQAAMGDVHSEKLFNDFSSLKGRGSFKERSQSTWTSVTVGPKDDKGVGDAKLLIVPTPGAQHNQLVEIKSDVINIELGEGTGRKKGKGKGPGKAEQAQRIRHELLGFVAFLLGLKEEQVIMETKDMKNDEEMTRSKVVVLKGISQSQRELIWIFQSKEKEKHDAHFAFDKIKADRVANNQETKLRNKELDEYRSLKEEISAADAAARTSAAASLLQQPMKKAAANPLLKAPIKGLKRSSEEAAAPQASEPPAAKALRTDGDAAAAGAAGSGSSSGDAMKDGAAAPAEAPAAAGTGGLGGLGGYDSEEDSEDDEKEALPPPAF
eukprot:TRINITY_DN31432_c0_g1_i1.p1 TRINITY_DN31432_c0_g1~~TRINITY_DN31432_c0_g1_i1.p1  ORF type:complete len:364 (+),score=104.47 TRINITY_DN31432_c0_g1_i1:35-1093(+)